MHWEDLEGSGGEGGGRGDRDGEHMGTPMAVSFQCMTKSTTIKKKKMNAKKKKICPEIQAPVVCGEQLFLSAIGRVLS